MGICRVRGCQRSTRKAGMESLYEVCIETLRRALVIARRSGAPSGARDSPVSRLVRYRVRRDGSPGRQLGHCTSVISRSLGKRGQSSAARLERGPRSNERRSRIVLSRSQGPQQQDSALVTKNESINAPTNALNRAGKAI